VNNKKISNLEMIESIQKDMHRYAGLCHLYKGLEHLWSLASEGSLNQTLSDTKEPQYLPLKRV
jgi:hypothetical protein